MSVYLMLFHGRKSRFKHMDDWGEQGPIFGPFDYVHNTYNSDLKLGDESQGMLPIINDLVYYDGMYYGDWSVFSSTVFDKSKELQNRLVPYDPKKAERPLGTRVQHSLKMSSS